MAFNMQGGSAASNDYDYKSGSGMDDFLSRAIDEVSWQTTLGSDYVTLSSLPIGLMPTTATPTNYDATQVSGSQGGTAQVGQTSINQDGSVQTTDSAGNTVLQVGVLA